MPFRRKILDKYLPPGVNVSDLSDDDIERLFNEFVARELNGPDAPRSNQKKPHEKAELLS